MKTLAFSEKIQIINGNPYVRPPDKILSELFVQANKETSPIPVKGKIDGAPFVQTLMRYENDWRLYVNIIMAKAAKIPFKKSIVEIVGEDVDIEITFDSSPPKFEMVSFLEEALNKNPDAKHYWEQLTPSRKKEVLRYFAGLKSEDAKQRNLKKILQALSGVETRFMARTWRDAE